MKKLLTMLTLTLAVGCVPPSDKNDDDEVPCGACQQNNVDNNQNNIGAPKSDLKGSFISGHLGNYWDCPDQGFTPDSGNEDSSGARPQGDQEFCAEGTDGCGGPLNCEGAQLTVRLTNGGDADATQIDVTKIEIFDETGLSLADLPVIAVYDASTNETLDDVVLQPGDSIDVRVDFQGPADLYSLLPADESGTRTSSTDSALIEVTVDVADDDPLVIDGGEVFVLPTVVT